MSATEKYKNTDFSFSLKSLMRSAQITQKDIARKTGVTQAAVSGWLNGSVPRGDKLARLAEVLEVTPNMLLRGEENDANIRAMVAKARTASETGTTPVEKQLLGSNVINTETMKLMRERIEKLKRDKQKMRKFLEGERTRIDKFLDDLAIGGD